MSISVLELENSPEFLMTLAETFVPSYGLCTGVSSVKVGNFSSDPQKWSAA